MGKVQMREMRNILIVGAGGREHALAWALARSSGVEQVFVAPGNAGTQWPATATHAACTTLPQRVDDLDNLLAFARAQHIDLTVVGPELPLSLGLVDRWQAAGLRVFGPSQAASQIETSKVFAKQFMQQQGIPTAAFVACSDYAQACQVVQDWGQGKPLVIKADGLAAGKGVFVCDTVDEALAALHSLLVERVLGAVGDQVIIEERLSGPEVSLLAFSDGVTVRAMPPARDHKRIFDGNRGPNTGGMGAFAPTPDVTPALVQQIVTQILQPAVQGMAQRSTPYVGVLYAGVMLTATGPMTLEFNCRFGDPETQVLVPLLPNLLDLLVACTEQRLHEVTDLPPSGACATVVLAAPGYPGAYATGAAIHGLETIADQPDLLVFHAGTVRQGEQIVTAGGRVLAVSGLGADLSQALTRAYAGVNQIHFAGMHYRKDIGVAYEM